jgi:hypothetical protein
MPDRAGIDLSAAFQTLPAYSEPSPSTPSKSQRMHAELNFQRGTMIRRLCVS